MDESEEVVSKLLGMPYEAAETIQKKTLSP